MSINALPQHASCDTRNFSDEYLLPTHYPFKASIDEEIDGLKLTHDFIIVCDDELIECRRMSRFTLSLGDAMDVLLAKKAKEYAGSQCYDETTGEPTFEFATALYSEGRGKTYYFIEI